MARGGDLYEMHFSICLFGLKFLLNDQLGVRKLGRLESYHLLGILFAKFMLLEGMDSPHFFTFPFGIQFNGKKMFPLLRKPCENNTCIYFITAGRPC